ncbi:MAG: hypothetical protein VYB52_01205 [Candidatus Neomarinimicrobiota bacterium]|nr:hypothetical protein [Candidatus Neomarinimicrobiota bacterium]
MDLIINFLKWIRSRPIVEKVIIHLTTTLIFSWIMFGNGFLTKSELTYIQIQVPGELYTMRQPGEIETVLLVDGFLSIGVFALIMIFIIFGGKKDI